MLKSIFLDCETPTYVRVLKVSTLGTLTLCNVEHGGRKIYQKLCRDIVLSQSHPHNNSNKGWKMLGSYLYIYVYHQQN